MRLNITTVEELKNLFLRVLFTKTDKVTKVSDESVTNAIAYGIGKVSQKALKDIAIVKTHLFPEEAYGSNLDTIAARQGVPARFGATGSSVYLRIVANPGTVYLQSQQTFVGQGITFQLVEDTTIGASGYTYVRARSVQQGENTNVNSLSIDRVVNQPEGHISVINEFKAQGGRDIEDDDLFRYRIINYPNLTSKHTLAFLTALMATFREDVIRVYKKGFDSNGRQVLGVMLSTGGFLTVDEMDELLDKITPYLPLNLVTPFSNPLVVLENCNYKPIDISFRVKVSSDSDLTRLRIELQDKMSKYLDLKFWDSRVVQWEYLLNIVSSNKYCILVPEKYFTPGSDITCYLGEYPRIRSFKMYNLEGQLLSENTNSFEPTLYSDTVIYED